MRFQLHTPQGIVEIDTDQHSHEELVAMGLGQIADIAQTRITLEAYCRKRGSALTNKELTLMIRCLAEVLGIVELGTFSPK